MGLTSDDLDELLMQLAHALDMVNNLPAGSDLVDGYRAALGVDRNELRLIGHAVRESWASNVRLLGWFFALDKTTKAVDARSYLGDGWTRTTDSVLLRWLGIASEHVAHVGEARVREPLLVVTAPDRRQLIDSVNSEANRFLRGLQRLPSRRWANTWTGYLDGLGLLA